MKRCPFCAGTQLTVATNAELHWVACQSAECGAEGPMRDTHQQAMDCLLYTSQKAQDECKSDWAYWGYQGDISYWTAVVSLLEAADLVGADNLPDVHYDDSFGVVMDVCGRQEDFGRAVLEQAKKRAAEADSHV